MSGELETNASPMQLARNSQVSILDVKFDGALLCEKMVADIEKHVTISPRLRAALTAVDPGFFYRERYRSWNWNIFKKVYDPLTTELYPSPLLLALCMEQLNLQPGQTFGHLGLGSGYALAVAAALVGPTGRCYGDASQATLDREAMARLQMARKCSSNASQWAPVEFLDEWEFYDKKSHFDALLCTTIVTIRSDTEDLQQLLAPGGCLVVALEPWLLMKNRLRLIRDDDRYESFDVRNFLASSPEYPKLKAEVQGWKKRTRGRGPVQTPRSGPPTLQQMAGKAVERFFMQGTAGRNWRAVMAELRATGELTIQDYYEEERERAKERLPAAETEDRRGLQSHQEPSASCGPLSDLQQTLRDAQIRDLVLQPLKSSLLEAFRDIHPQAYLFSCATSAALDLMTRQTRAWITFFNGAASLGIVLSASKGGSPTGPSATPLPASWGLSLDSLARERPQPWTCAQEALTGFLQRILRVSNAVAELVKRLAAPDGNERGAAPQEISANILQALADIRAQVEAGWRWEDVRAIRLYPLIKELWRAKDIALRLNRDDGQLQCFCALMPKAARTHTIGRWAVVFLEMVTGNWIRGLCQLVPHLEAEVVGTEALRLLSSEKPLPEATSEEDVYDLCAAFLKDDVLQLLAQHRLDEAFLRQQFANNAAPLPPLIVENMWL